MNTIRNHISLAVLALAAEGLGAGTQEAPETGATLAALTDETKVNAIKKVLPARKRYDSIADAIAALTKAAGETDNFYGLPIAIQGQDADGNVDESVYESMGAIVARVNAKGDEAKGKESGIKGIVVFPVPTLDSLIGDESGKAWLDKIAEKEAALVIFRSFREASTLDEFNAGVAKSPKTMAELIAQHTRGAAGLDTETFDATWPGLRTFLKKKQPNLDKALPQKAEVIKCIRSASYANSDPDTAKLESAGVFVKLAQTCIAAAQSNKNDKTGEANPLDTSAIQSWLDGRDSLEIKKAEKAAVDVDAAIADFANWA